MSVGKGLKYEPDASLTSSCLGLYSFRRMPGIKKTEVNEWSTSWSIWGEKSLGIVMNSDGFRDSTIQRCENYIIYDTETLKHAISIIMCDE